MVLPAWVALMEQVPAVSSLMVLTLTVQTAGVVLASVTVRPELAVAATVNGATPKVLLPGLAKVMVCALRTAKLRVTLVAAA